MSDSDREQLVDALKRHAADGRLEIDELERRVGVVYTAQSREQAVSALADLPPLPVSAPKRRRGRGHGDADAPAPDWLPTSERFRDPGTGRIMCVWVDAGGGRHYVAQDDGSDHA